MAGRAQGTPAGAATFELESFTWSGPDRLELAGRFTGLPDTPAAAPVLIVRGAEATHRLPAVGESVPARPDEGARWSAEFAWQQAPIPFDGAELQLGGDLVVALPAPGGRRSRFRHRIFAVRRPGEDGAQAAPEPAAPPSNGVERVHLEGELLAAHEQVRELHGSLELAQEELRRARADLAAERSRHSGDAERFREALEQVRASAAEAVAAEQVAAGRRLEEMGRELSDQTAAAAQLGEEVAGLRRAAEEAEPLRARLERARGAADAARSDAEQIVARLTNIRDELGDGS
jgi:hypothetical protein